MKRLKDIMALAAVVLYVISHIFIAISLYGVVKIWVFAVVLLVPVIGSMIGVGILIGIDTWAPVVLWGISLSLYSIANALSSRCK